MGRTECLCVSYADNKSGYGVHSLALVADSFHMVSTIRSKHDRNVGLSRAWSQLNDVLSLCVGLWAVKVANEKPSSKMYTYGVRAYFLKARVCKLTKVSGNGLRHWAL